jgi:membrane protease YdiL (CAAX protease family)
MPDPQPPAPLAGADEPAPITAPAADATAPRVWRQEILLVLALSLGASAVASLISFTGVLTAPGAVSAHTTTLVGSAAPGRPWLDLAWQVFRLVTNLVPVALVLHLLSRSGESTRTLGFDASQPRKDLLRGLAVAAGIGGSGLALYFAARAAGVNLNVVPADLPDVWWRYPMLVLFAIQNGVLEEVVVLGFLVHRLSQLGWSFRATTVTSAVLRGSYHLYQGVGGFAGNVAMGLIFCWLYRRWGRVTPLVIAHAVIDTVAFAGFTFLKARYPSLLPH